MRFQCGTLYESRVLRAGCVHGAHCATEEGQPKPTNIMLRTAITFFVIALIAILLGAGGVGSLAMNIGYVLAVIGVILFVVNALTGKR